MVKVLSQNNLDSKIIVEVDYPINNINLSLTNINNVNNSLPGPGAYENQPCCNVSNWNKRSFNLRYQPPIH